MYGDTEIIGLFGTLNDLKFIPTLATKLISNKNTVIKGSSLPPFGLGGLRTVT